MARMRKKKNLSGRMNACRTYWFDVPVANRGRWRNVCGFPDTAPLYIELGCGKGKFAVETAALNPGVCYIALEKDESVILAAIERAAAAGVKNVFFVCTDVLLLKNYFSDGEADRIYINFCDPWSRRNKPKRRLTYRGYLEAYKIILKPDGQIHFKTDNSVLFEFSLEEFKAVGLRLKDVTTDLHASQWNDANIRTEFESKFAEKGIKIKRAEAHKV